MTISIITVVYNNAASIEQCILSVLSQSYSPIEYIIIDGNSTDGTKEIIQSYSSGISKFISEKDKGIFDAFNKGVLQCTGDIIGFLHSDDIYANTDVISKVAAIFRQSPDIWAVYGDLQFVSKKQPDRIIRNWKSTSFKKSLLSKGWMPAHPTLFLKKDVYQKYGLFDISYKVSADYDFILRIFSQPGFSAEYIPEVFTKMRMGGNSVKMSNMLIKSREDYQILRRNKVGNLFTLLRKIFSKFNQFYT